MLLAAALLSVGALAGWFTGRRPPARRNVTTAEERGGWGWKLGALVPAGAALLLVGTRWMAGSGGVALMGAGYAALLVFAAANSSRPGLMLIAVGLLANAAVIVTDAGMPVAGLPAEAVAGGHHHAVTGTDRLTGLADNLRLAPLRETVSAGDLLMAGGAAVALFFWLEPRRRPGAGTA